MANLLPPSPDPAAFSSFETVLPATGRRQSIPSPQTSPATTQAPPFKPPESHILDDDSDMIAAFANRAQVNRSDSMFSETEKAGAPMSTPATIRTHSIPGPFGVGGVTFERSHSVPTDDDLIIVTVRLSNKFRSASLDGSEELPSRPRPRSFLRRMSTRLHLDHAAEKEERYKALKLPRREYRRHFVRDANGDYAGSEPERAWSEDDLMREFGEYQNLPLHSMYRCMYRPKN